MTIRERIKNAFSAFTSDSIRPGDTVSYSRPDKVILSTTNAKTIMAGVFNKLANDCASVAIRHCETDENDNFVSYINSGLDYCLTTEANIDQTSKGLIRDLIMSMFDEGVICAFPSNWFEDKNKNRTDILEMRIAKIIKWAPKHVTIEAYNDITGRKEQLTVQKKDVAIIENPYYAVMNAPNSTVNRLNRKLALLDKADEEYASGKLNIVIQLPYAVKTPGKRQIANERLQNIEEQMKSSPLGIAYIDAAEHIVQLNRPADNQLLSQVDSLIKTLYEQLEISPTILDGTATPQTLTNYWTGPIETLLSAICDEFSRKFISYERRTVGRERVKFFRDVFRMVSAADLAEITDKFTRNEVLTSNEIRQKMGIRPSEDPKADELRNSNISESANQMRYDVYGNQVNNNMQEGIQNDGT